MMILALRSDTGLVYRVRVGYQDPVIVVLIYLLIWRIFTLVIASVALLSDLDMTWW